MAPTLKALIRHVVVGGLWQPVKWRAEQELISELTQARYPSFPFISPDTFRALCDVVIESNEVKRRSSMTTRTLIFFDLSEIEGTETSFDDKLSLKLLETELGSAAEPPVVIMSHGDFAPTAALLGDIARLSAMLFTVNIVEETEKIRALPLGLENFSRHRNGRLKDFFECQDFPSKLLRTRDVFAAFEPENNPLVRGPLVEMLRDSRFESNSRRLLPAEYRNAVRESLFVLSPPGRGLDCHRTWEAIYLGAVPVILEGTLSPSLTSRLPVLVVPTYEEFLGKGHAEMVELHHQIRATSSALAYAPHWIVEIGKVANA